MGHIIFIVLHILAVLFGLIGLFITIPLHIIYTVIDDKNRADNSNTKICPFCKETIKKGSIICRYCNNDLIIEPIKEKELPKKVDDCPRCAEFRKQKILKCFECGKDLSK